MRISRASLVCLSLLVSLLGGVQFPASAQDSTAVVVEASRARPDFPGDITFELDAAVEGAVLSVDLVYQLANLETMQLLPAEFELDGDDLSAEAVADLETYFLPVGIDLTYHWIITLNDDVVVETSSNVVTWIDDRFDWDRVDGPGIEIYSYDRSDGFEDLMLEVGSQAVVDLTALYQPEVTFPIRIWVYESGEDYAGTLAENSQGWSAGSAYPDLQVIQAVIPDDSDSEVLRVIPHEISHQVLNLATLNPYNAPATWIDEGLAVLAQTGGENLYRTVVMNAAREDELISLRSLISSFPYDAAGARLAYAQSFSAVQYLVAVYGEDAVLAIVDAYEAGNSHNDVLLAAIGLSIDEFDADWRAHLEVQL